MDAIVLMEMQGHTQLSTYKELSMNLKAWETTIQQLTEESNAEAKESGKQKLLMAWREKLTKEPHRLQLYQIDEIVREVRKRLKNCNPQSSDKSQATIATTIATVQLSG